MTAAPRPRRAAHIDYRWIALSNTTLGILMAALNASTVLIAMPGCRSTASPSTRRRSGRGSTCCR